MNKCKDNKLLISLIDKPYPPNHSFVDDMLSKQYPNDTGNRVILLLEKNPKHKKVIKHGKSIVLNVLPRRKGLRRILIPLVAHIYINLILSRYSCWKISYLVRNDPTMLVGVLLTKKRNQRVTYQNSFPHELFNKFSLKGLIAKIIIIKLLSKIDAVITVSEKGKERISNYGFKKDILTIPLCSNPHYSNIEIIDPLPDCLNFLYVGTHDENRRLEFCFNSILKAREYGVSLKIRSVGGNAEEVDRYKRLYPTGTIDFLPKVSRENLIEHYRWGDIGISLIPPLKIFYEASPTKFAEYLGAGLIVLANKEITFQKEMAERCKSIKIANFNQTSITKSVCEIWSSRDNLRFLQKSAKEFASKELNYRNYISDLESILW